MRRIAALVLLGFLGAATPAAATFAGSNGLIAFTCRFPEPQAVCVARPDESRVWKLTRPEDLAVRGVSVWDNEPEFSPDGRRLAFVRYVRDREATTQELHVLDLGGGPEQVIRAADVGSPTWSPDGRKIAWMGVREIVIVDLADQSRATIPLRDDGVWSFGGTLDWRPSGGGFAINRSKGLACGVRAHAASTPPCDPVVQAWFVPEDGSPPRALTRARRVLGSPHWHPDGTRLLANCEIKSICEIDAGTGAVTILRRGTEQDEAVYSPDGAFIAIHAEHYGQAIGILPTNGATEPKWIGHGLEPSWQPGIGGFELALDPQQSFRPARLTSRKVRTRDGRIKLRVACPSGGGRCVGFVLLRSGGEPCRVLDGGRARRFELKSGTQQGLTYSLTGSEQRTLRRRGRARICGNVYHDYNPVDGGTIDVRR